MSCYLWRSQPRPPSPVRLTPRQRPRSLLDRTGTGQPVPVPAKRLPFFKVGKELKKCLSNSFSIEKIASWAENLYRDPRRFSPEVNDILDTLSMMSLGPEFYYSERELWLLADLMENNIDRPLEKLKIKNGDGDKITS